MNPLRLDGLAVVRVSGNDRNAFLQGQLTQDLTGLQPGRTLLWGWNNPKGRLLAIGQAFDSGGATLLTLPRSLADTMVQGLRRYLLRTRAELEVAPLGIAGLSLDATAGGEYEGLTIGAEPDACGTDSIRTLGRVVGDPARALLIAPMEHLPTRATAEAADAWELADIRAGLPAISPATIGAFVPQMINLDLLGGISFTKGCYVGQEVVARTQNLGRIKRRMFRFASAARAEAGTDLLDTDGNKAGKVVRCAPADAGHELLGVVQLAAVRGPLFTGGALLEPLPLPYTIPDSA